METNCQFNYGSVLWDSGMPTVAADITIFRPPMDRYPAMLALDQLRQQQEHGLRSRCATLLFKELAGV